MARTHGTGPDGVELDLIGRPLNRRSGPASGLHFGGNTMKATYDGKYLLNGHQFRMRAGQPLPPGAEPMADPNAEPEPETKGEREPETKVEKAPRAPKAKAKG